MAKREYETKAGYLKAVRKRGLSIITTRYGEDFAHGVGGNYGVGVVVEGDGRLHIPSYSAVLYDTALEFENYAWGPAGFACPPRGLKGNNHAE